MKLSFIKVTVILVFSYFFSTSKSILIAQDKAQIIDHYVQNLHENGEFNGTILVAEKGKVILTKGYGFAYIVLPLVDESLRDLLTAYSCLISNHPPCAHTYRYACYSNVQFSYS